MGCNCKSGKVQRINNLKSKEHLKMAQEIMDDLINTKPQREYTDLDWLEIFAVYQGLYPNSSQQPTKEDAVDKIKLAANLYQTKYYTK